MVVHLLWSTCLLQNAMRSICVGFIVRYYIVGSMETGFFYHSCSCVPFPVVLG